MTNSPPRWFDSHCHFDFPDFDDDREQIWSAAQTSGCAGLLIPGITRTQSEKLPQVCAAKPWFYAQGLHPYFLSDHQPGDEEWLDQALRNPAVVAVGECGLDRVLAGSEAELERQWYWFRVQAELAAKHHLPLILHIRGMHDEAASWLRRSGFANGGMVHAFSGSEQQAKRWLDLGFGLGIGGALTHPRASKLRRTVKALPDDGILLETDSPDMAPAFWGMRRNDPRSLPLTIAITAKLKGWSLACASAKSISNAMLLFSGLSIKQ